MSESMIERVARALCAAAEEDWNATTFSDTANGCDPEEMRSHWRMMARAAIEAMREPTDAMVDAANSEVRPDSDNLQCPDWYSAAIDAALNEQVPG